MSHSNAKEILEDPGTFNGPCPACGAPRNVWPDDDSGGYEKNGAVYCCTGCRDGAGCTCDHMGLEHGQWSKTTDEVIAADRSSGEFLEAHRKENKTIEPHEYGDPNVAKSSGPTQGVD
jgi:hypothetical protein